jgi:hypothetical protein
MAPEHFSERTMIIFENNVAFINLCGKETYIQLNRSKEMADIRLRIGFQRQPLKPSGRIFACTAAFYGRMKTLLFDLKATHFSFIAGKSKLFYICS